MIKNYSPLNNHMRYFVKRLAILIVLFSLTSITLNAQSDLSITKTVNNATPNVGDEITFTITIHNEGPNVATGVTVRDVIPSGYGNLTNVSNGGSTTGTTILWPGLTIPVGVTPADDIVLTVNVTVLASGDYNNRAEIIASDQVDPDSDPSLSFDDDDLTDGQPDDDETGFSSCYSYASRFEFNKNCRQFNTQHWRYSSFYFNANK